ncbi:MAG TPA: helix-turn-helix transcriptional regulator [Clostridia bacterium]|nr:helix-turn-helix transcriptional regulator [Clostridiaceae bacterium]HPB18095.1 helix-turn-helix transcriptional regulator [Clostridia bacterium]HQM97297.1 helix-turn-helix transcriptional regulator [Clostridia bacterium]HQO70134.1 helix-turn-helix transcriptional regulator [Clostridia bacterium]
MNTLGKRIAELRRGKNITQDEMAEKLNVTAQAVSKWENDISCPDIMLLPKIAQMLSVTVDELLSDAPKKNIEFVPEDKRKSIDDLMFRIYVNSKDGDKVKVNLPMPLVKMGLEMGVKMPAVSGNEALKGVDFAQLITLVDQGLIGKLVEVESADGDIVEIVVE